MKKKYYTVYNNKTDEIVAFGTAEECAKKLRLKSINCFYALVSRNGPKYSVVKEERDDVKSDA